MSRSDKLVLTDKMKAKESITRSKESTDNLSISHEIDSVLGVMTLCSYALNLIDSVTSARNAVFVLL